MATNVRVLDPRVRVKVGPVIRKKRTGLISVRTTGKAIVKGPTRRTVSLPKEKKDQKPTTENILKTVLLDIKGFDLRQSRPDTLREVRDAKGSLVGYRDITTKRSIVLTRNQANTLERVRNQEQQINTLLKKKVISAQAGRSIKRQLSKEGVKEFTGRIEESKRGRGLSRIEGWINRERQKQLTAQTRAEGVIERIFRGTVVLGGLGLVRGAVGTLQAISQPIETAKGFIRAAKQPVKTIRTVAADFRIDPVGTITEFYAYNKALNSVTKAARRSPVGRFVNEELYIRSQPKEIRSAVRSIIKSSKAQEAINPFNIKSIKKVDFAEVKSLTKTEAKALSQALAKTDSVVFGSLAGRTLAKKRLPLPKDVDLATKNISKFNKEFLDNIPRNQRGNYLIKGEKIIRKSNKEAILDVKPLSRLIPDKSILTQRGYLPVSGYVTKLAKGKESILPKLVKKPGISRLEIPTQKIVKVGKIKLVGLGEQVTRKGLGTLQVLIEKNFKRAKDPQAFVTGLQLQLEGLKALKPKNLITKAKVERKIKVISTALKILTSKQFLTLLEKKVKGILQEYPILRSIDLKELKKAKVFKGKDLLKELRRQKLIEKKLVKFKDISSLVPKKKLRSYLPKVKSKLKSKLPTRKKSIISKLPKKKKPSVIPSRIKEPLSKIPILSIVPKLSGIPASRIPPSKLAAPSKLFINSILKNFPLGSKITLPKLSKTLKEYEDRIKKEKIDKALKRAKTKAEFIYLPDLKALLFNEKAGAKQKLQLLKPGKTFTGLERRRIVKG